MSRSPSDTARAEERAKAESLKKLAQDLGLSITDAQAKKHAEKRVREAMERKSRAGKL